MLRISQSLDNSQLMAAARMFSSAVFKEMARTGKSPMFSRLAVESSLVESLDATTPISCLFEVAFTLLKRKAYRYEYAYKAALTHKILLGVHSLRTASMLTEFRVGGCKADLAILNGTSTVYEIKSERDKLDRLENQISAYRKVFAKVNIVTGENHVDSILSFAPADVGVMLLNDRFQISTIRDAINCPEKIVPTSVFDSIQRNEAIKILGQLNVDIPDVPNTKIYQVMRECFETLPPIALHDCMVRVLKETRSLLPLSELIEALPRSLQAAAFSTPLRQQDHARLLSAVETPIQEALHWV